MSMRLRATFVSLLTYHVVEVVSKGGRQCRGMTKRTLWDLSSMCITMSWRGPNREPNARNYKSIFGIWCAMQHAIRLGIQTMRGWVFLSLRFTLLPFVLREVVQRKKV